MNPILPSIAVRRLDRLAIQTASMAFLLVASSADGQVLIETTVTKAGWTEIRPTAATGPLRREPNRGKSEGLQDSASLRWRSMELRPRISYGYVSGDGILANPGDLRTTNINTYGIGLAVKQGSHWSADYTGSRSYYSNSGFRDTSAQSVSLSTAITYRAWAIKASQSYLSESLPNVDTAKQTRQETHLTALTAVYSINSRLSTESILDQELHFPDQYSTTREWNGREWVNYRLADRLEVSAGIQVGYVGIIKAEDMFFDRPQIRARWQISAALFLEASGGIEHRKIYRHPAKHLNNAIYNASLRYTPFQTTALLLSGARDITASYFSRQATIDTTLTATLQQRILRHFYLSAGIETQRAHYIRLQDSPLDLSPRDDKRRNLELKLSTTIRTRTTVSVFLRRSKNDTNLAGYGFSSDQFGLEAIYSY